MENTSLQDASLKDVKLIRSVKAWQFVEGVSLPPDVHRCVPEVTWSERKDLIYFTFPTFRPSYWMSIAKLKEKPIVKGFESYVKFTQKNEEPYFRVVFPFSLYEIKSNREKRVEYIDDATVRLYADYALMHNWSHEWPAVAEHREPNGSYGRGFKPTYINLSDWLITNPKGDVEVLTNQKFQELRG